MKYCKNCKQKVEPQADWSWGFSFGGFLLGYIIFFDFWWGLVTGMLIGLLKYSINYSGRCCPICHATNWRKEDNE